MQSVSDLAVSLFVRDRATGRLVFNAKAIQALGLSPLDLSQRGYPVGDEIAGPAMVPEEQAEVLHRL
jgi:hypothetical protein